MRTQKNLVIFIKRSKKINLLRKTSSLLATFQDSQPEVLIRRKAVLITFPFRYAPVSSLGEIFLPIIPVSLKSVTGWKEFEFLVDTGADLTTMPNSTLKLLGKSEKDCKKGTAEGIGGKIITTWETEIWLKIANRQLKVRCAITQDDRTPFLLGRVDLLDDVFSLHIDSKEKLIIFETI